MNKEIIKLYKISKKFVGNYNDSVHTTTKFTPNEVEDAYINNYIGFIKEATKRGIERITELGKMSYFNYPWDGMFPLNQFVRWASYQN